MKSIVYAIGAIPKAHLTLRKYRIMKELCINTIEKLQVGQITVGTILNESMEDTPIALRIIEEITLNEYLKFVKERKLEHLVKRSIHKMLFYRAEILD